MSVAPLDDLIIVALDFEGAYIRAQPSYTDNSQIGVHSIERSAQEDTLLVLFNTAISNLVGVNSCIFVARTKEATGSIP